MANPLYGQNKADGFLDTLADADDKVAAAGTGGTAAGNAAGVATKVIPITIAGVEYFLALYPDND